MIHTLQQQRENMSILIDELIENNIPETLILIRETMCYSEHEDDKEMVQRIDSYFNLYKNY